MKAFRRIPVGIQILILVLIFIIPIGSSFYRYYITQDYNYLIEAECDPSQEICYSRDCEEPDACPPNNFAYYKQYLVKAYDFEKCSDNSCKKECENKTVECKQIFCGESEDDACTTAVE